MIVSKFQDLRRLKAYEEKRNLPLRTIATETGMALATIQRVAKGELEGVRVSTLETMCRYFACQSISDLMEYVPEAANQE